MEKIYIHKGDCTVFADVKSFLTFNIETEMDLAGYKAQFILGYITKSIDDISSKSFEVILSAEETRQLRLGEQHGAVILTDNNGHIKTVVNTIPFVVTNEVVDRDYQLIDLTIPQSSGIDIKLKVGTVCVTSVNGMTGDVVLTAQDVGALPTDTIIPDISNLATKDEIPSLEGLATQEELAQGLNTKQNKGNYALKSELPTVPTHVSELENDSNYATQTQVLQAIAAIPQFNLSIVEALPETGEKMTLYLVPKEGTNNDVYDEYIWIEQTTSFEHLGTTAVDLTDYVKKTDYAQGGVGGVVKASNTFACGVTNGYLQTTQIPVGTRYDNLSQYAFIGKGTLENIKNDFVKRAITTNDIELTDEEKTSARTWLGAVGDTDYAGIGGKAGVIKVSAAYGFSLAPSNGYLTGISRTLEQFEATQNNAVISKGTLGNVLTQYSKTVLTTEADYEALETKDANTLYLIEE